MGDMTKAILSFAFAALCLSTSSLLVGQSVACMGVQPFSKWAEGRASVYHAQPYRAEAIKKGHKKLKLGMSLQEANSIMPPPDWAEDSWKGCTWYYALMVGSDNVTSEALGVRFNAEGAVNGLSKNGIVMSESSAKDKHSIPTTVDEAVQVLKTKWLSAKDLDWILRNPQKEVVYTLYRPFGTGVRNEFRLWGDNQALRDSCGDNDPEGCSVVIFNRLWDSVRADADPELVKQIDCQTHLAESIHINPKGFRKLTLGKLFEAIQSQTNNEVAKSAADVGPLCQNSITLETSGKPELECFADVNLEDKQTDVTLKDLLWGVGFGTFFSVSNYPPKIVLSFSRKCQFKTPPYLYGKSW